MGVCKLRMEPQLKAMWIGNMMFNNGSGSISAQNQMLATEESALKGTLKFAAISSNVCKQIQLHFITGLHKIYNWDISRQSGQESGQLSFRSFEHRTPLPAECGLYWPISVAKMALNLAQYVQLKLNDSAPKKSRIPISWSIEPKKSVRVKNGASFHWWIIEHPPWKTNAICGFEHGQFLHENFSHPHAIDEKLSANWYFMHHISGESYSIQFFFNFWAESTRPIKPFFAVLPADSKMPSYKPQFGWSIPTSPRSSPPI